MKNKNPLCTAMISCSAELSMLCYGKDGFHFQINGNCLNGGLLLLKNTQQKNGHFCVMCVCYGSLRAEENSIMVRVVCVT